MCGHESGSNCLPVNGVEEYCVNALRYEILNLGDLLDDIESGVEGDEGIAVLLKLGLDCVVHDTEERVVERHVGCAELLALCAHDTCRADNEAYCEE